MITIHIENAFYTIQKKQFPCLSDVSISFDEGTCLLVLGASGCGKSTLLKIIGGLHRDFSGGVAINGKPLDKAFGIAYIPQACSLLPWFTVYENIARMKKITSSFVQEELFSLLNALQIYDIKDAYPTKISGGQAQRVSLARAFFTRPSILLMDEPFSALDEVTREQIQHVFLQLQQEYQIATVFVTHSIQEALILGQKIVVLKKPPHSVAAVLEQKTRLEKYSAAFYAEENHLREVIRNGKD